MTLADWVSQSVDRVREEGWCGVKDSKYELYIGALRRLGHVYNYGDPIFEKEWDVLVILDACRADLMREVDGEYDFLDNPGTIDSVASTSIEWMDKTFAEPYHDKYRETTYVTGNPFSEEHVDANDLYELDEVWRYAWDDDAGTIRPRPLTDRAIAHRRRHPSKRLIIHYMQPHYPFIEGETSSGIEVEAFDNHSVSVWDRLRRGEIDESEVWAEYRDNLRLVLDDVALLLDNIDAETVAISSDHGNCLGEYGLYGHPGYAPIPPLKRVPWYTTNATNRETHDPTDWGSSEDQSDVEQRLEDLGYK